MLGGVVYAAIEIRHYREQRLDTAAIEAVRSMQSAEFLRAFRVLRTLPDYCALADLRARGIDFEDDLMTAGGTLEALGILVFRRLVPLDIAQQVVGGAATLLWRKVGTSVEEMRVEQGHETLLEWFQWLAEQFERSGESRREPAYRAHRSWPSG